MKKEFYSGSLSINKDPKSPFWMVSFRDARGRQRRRSTKVPVNGGMFEGVNISAKTAEKLAYQRGVQIACEEEERERTENQVTLREHVARFQRKREGLVSEATNKNARTTFKYFFEYLGHRADEPIQRITKADIKEWVAARRKTARRGTVHKDLSIISAAFSDAVDCELMAANPCHGVKVPPELPEEKMHKAAFTLEEIKLMIRTFPPEWSSMVRCCFETYGQRMHDIATLDWSQFDWKARLVHINPHKTGREMHQPMRPGFYKWARAAWKAAGEPGSGLLHPNILAKGPWASTEFGILCDQAGISARNAAGRRTKTFHCIRSTCATIMHASGLSQGMAMHLVGHESEQIHRVYVRPSAEQLREAASKLPGID